MHCTISDKQFFQTAMGIAVPVTIQSMLQSSFSMIDQIMLGQLGSTSVAGVGLAGKFISIHSVLIAAFGAVAGIMIAQYMGQKNHSEVQRSFRINLTFALLLAAGFTAVSLAFPTKIMAIYTSDPETVQTAASYLRIFAGSFFPAAGAAMLAALLRCMEKASISLYASMAAALTNTVLNYILIFGKWGFYPMGSDGAAVATVISQWINIGIMLLLYGKVRATTGVRPSAAGRFLWKQYCAILLPLLVCEFLWSLGENVYAAIYGHLGTGASAAMMLTSPIQGLMIGALCGLSQAASVIIGKMLGNREFDDAYHASWKLIRYGLIGAVVLSIGILLLSDPYLSIYAVEPEVKELTKQILTVYAIIAPCKVLNMIIGGGIIRCGGQTRIAMLIDMTGTWFFGVPMGLISAFVLRLPIPWVYLFLSLEECVRLIFSLVILRKRKWMHQLSGGGDPA